MRRPIDVEIEMLAVVREWDRRAAIVIAGQRDLFDLKFDRVERKGRDGPQCLERDRRDTVDGLFRQIDFQIEPDVLDIDRPIRRRCAAVPAPARARRRGQSAGRAGSRSALCEKWRTAHGISVVLLGYFARSYRAGSGGARGASTADESNAENQQPDDRRRNCGEGEDQTPGFADWQVPDANNVVAAEDRETMPIEGKSKMFNPLRVARELS